jgi:hypothetical protein
MDLIRGGGGRGGVFITALGRSITEYSCETEVNFIISDFSKKAVVLGI